MKKITLLLSFLAFSFGFSQELVTNGGFDGGSSAGWAGSSVNVVDQGGNFVNEADVAAPGNPWDANISYILSLTAGTSYTFSFVAWTDATTMSRDIIAGIGLNEDPWSAATVTTTLSDSPQTFTYTLVAPATNANSRVIFDMGAQAGFVFIDDVSLMEVVATCSDGIQNGDETGVDCGGSSCAPCAASCTDGIMNGDETGIDCGGSSCAPCSTPPVTIPTTPPNRPVDDVVSIFSDAYTDIAVGTWGPDWGPASARINDYNIVTRVDNATKVIDLNAGQVFAGIDFAASKFDATDFTHFHMDYYIPGPLATGQALSIKLSNHDGAAETSAIQITPTPQVDGWVELDIPLGDFVAASAPANLDRNAIAQIVITAARADGNIPVDIYIDNIYFHKNTTLSIEENESLSFNAFPNPTINNWNIKSSQSIDSIQIFDVLGKQVLSLNPKRLEVVIDASSLNSGLYFAKINTVNGTKTLKLVKE